MKSTGLMMSERKMIIGLHLSNSYGSHPAAWRAAETDPKSYTNIDALVAYAQMADRCGLQFIFVPDRPLLDTELTDGPPRFLMEPLVLMTAVARATRRIGIVPSVSTSLNEPYTIARQLKALDVISHGRVGWNAIATNDPDAFANYGQQLPPRQQKYERLHETIQLVQALWGSWGREAGEPDQQGNFANPAHVQPINLYGQHVGSQGPLPIPPSEQGQPVIFQAGGGGAGLQVASRYADVVIGMPMTIEQGQAYRDTVRTAALEVGRRSDDIKVVMFVTVSLGSTVRDALDRRLALDQKTDLSDRLAQLGGLLGLTLTSEQADSPLTARQLEDANSTQGDARSARALNLARDGWSVKDILAHGVLEYNPVTVGTPEDVADFLEAWFNAGATDGFILSVDVLHDGLPGFVNEVVPILLQRQLFQADHAVTTLRRHLGAQEQYGVR